MKKILLLINNIIESIRVWIKLLLFKRDCKYITITDKGEYLFRYCKDKVDGKDVYIEDYEKYLNDFADQFNVSYEDVYKLFVNLHEVVMGDEVTQFEFDSDELKGGGH